MQIAGSKTPADWGALKVDLLAYSSQSDWEQAYADFFLRRLRLRYLDPIRVLQENSNYQGEGFSIVAIQCSLVEFLESTYLGMNYRYLRQGDTLGPNEYSSNKVIFIQFVTTRHPFREHFTSDLATDFYVGVRCGLLHEATTRNGWTIWGAHNNGKIIDPQKKIVFRDNLQLAFQAFLGAYKTELLSDRERQSAFIRKFDSLCE